MNRKIVLVMSLTLVLIGMFGAALKIQRVEASGTIFIRADGRVEPDTANITSADNVTYTFTGNINESIVVERDNIVVNGVGYTLQGTGSGTGIDLSDRSNVTIKNTNIDGFHYGVYLNLTSYSVLYGNNITNNYYGIYLSDSSGKSISGNNITGNEYGIDLRRSSYYNISGNNITNNWRGIKFYKSMNNTISGNKIAASDKSGVYLDDSSNNDIFGNNIASNKQEGIVFSNSSSNTMYGNNITNNLIGIDLEYYSSNNTISGNNITDNKYPGICLDYASSNTISGNTITNNEYGIDLEASSSNNTISGNTITNNSISGIWLDYSSNNTISGNNITNNEYGIGLSSYSSNNKFYHNNFIDNTIKQVDIPYSDYANFWDDGVEGNYWSNYTGVDSNHDGIGDSPHVLDANNTDYYPLMGMFHSFKTPPGYDVNVISNSTIEDFQYFEANSTIKMYVSNMTANQTFGFCRVCIPHTLMDPNNIWVVIDDGQTEVLFANSTLYDNTTHRWIYFAYPHSTHEVMIGEDNTPPLIENVYQQPAEDTVYPDDKVEVYANVTDDLSGVKQVILNYTTNNGTWFSKEMTNLEGNLYNATIPEFPYCTNVTYVIIAEDNANNTITTEEMEYEYQYHVIPEFPTWTSMLLILIMLTAATAIYKRRLPKTPTH